MALTGANVTIGGINFTAPFNMPFPRGTILNMQASKVGYTKENRTVTVQDSSSNGYRSQRIIFLLSANLVISFNVFNELQYFKKTFKLFCSTLKSKNIKLINFSSNTLWVLI